MNTNLDPGTRNTELARRVLIVGVSTRAAAESAARAGFDVTAIDAFADLDQHPSVRALSLPRDFGRQFTARAVVKATRGLPSDAVVYLSDFENHPDAVAALSAGRALWGNLPEVLRRVRNPLLLSECFARHGCRAPRVRLCESSDEHAADAKGRQWLLKPLASGGGHRVRLWHTHEAIPADHYAQEFIDGTAGSIVFVAAKGKATALGVSRQLVGERAFGAADFRYCGSIVDTPISDALAQSAAALVQGAAAAFDLSGVGSIDFITEGESVWPIELNPRWTASMELVERARGVSLFAIHRDACVRGVVPDFDFRRAPVSAATHGKAVVFARHDVIAGDTRQWLMDTHVRDIPRPGEHIAAGQPICTVFAQGQDERTCHEMLVERAEQIYRALG